MRKLAHAELHHATVTGLDRDGPGGIAIAAPLLRAAGISPLEEVCVISRRNGQQWTTHALLASAEDAVVVQGGAVSLFVVGHELDIVAFVHVEDDGLRERGLIQRFVEAGPNNEVQRVHRRVVEWDGEGFACRTVAEKIGPDHPLVL